MFGVQFVRLPFTDVTQQIVSKRKIREKEKED